MDLVPIIFLCPILLISIVVIFSPMTYIRMSKFIYKIVPSGELSTERQKMIHLFEENPEEYSRRYRCSLLFLRFCGFIVLLFGFFTVWQWYFR